jgi:hypothetical protein
MDYLSKQKFMASTVKERATWKLKKSVATAEGSEKENAMHIRPGRFATKVTLLPRGRVASRQAKVGVISGLWGDLASRVLGAMVMGKRWAVAV